MPRTGAIATVVYTSPTTVFIKTTPCVVCGKQHQFTLSRFGYENWQRGELIQRAFPELTAADRETLISGTCSGCFDELWKEEE